MQLRVGSLPQPPVQVQNPGGTWPMPIGSTIGEHGCPPHEHLLSAQVAPSGQRVPQPPQLRMSDARLTQPSAPQQVWPRLHLSPLGGQPQLPPRQIVPTGQMAPQSPQFCGSRDTSWQLVPQHFPPH